MRGPLRRFGYGNFDPVGFADVGGTLVFDGTAYGPALDSGTGGVVEPIITFNGSDVQVVGQLGAGSEPPNLNPTEIYLGGQPGNYTSYVVDTPSGTSGRPGHRDGCGVLPGLWLRQRACLLRSDNGRWRHLLRRPGKL